MARYGSADVGFLLLGQYSLLGRTTRIAVVTNYEVTEETTPLGVSAAEHDVVGVHEYELAQDGFFDDAAAGVHVALVGTLGSSAPLGFAPEGNTAGKLFVGMPAALVQKYDRLPARRELTKYAARYVPDGDVSPAAEDGVVSQPLAALTGNGDSTAVDNGAATTAGGAFYVFCTAIDLDGGTNIVAKLQDSADDISYGDVSGATKTLTAAAAERIAIAGTIRRYTYTTRTWTGGGGSRTATIATAVVRS